MLWLRDFQFVPNEIHYRITFDENLPPNMAELNPFYHFFLRGVHQEDNKVQRAGSTYSRRNFM